ncbi:uncharacterized protein LOC116146774 [Pistacia vera]|uniref:uncharacterized protein LOC116146774 n=1 Tax=Pistacia vera TaxID=55513 RepID=UPI001263B5A7|nr:uncharacterized protein LOC116146774 [Pistacia vera]
MEGREPFKSWEELKAAVIARFWPSFQGSAHEALVALKQNSTVTEYREDFESHTAPVKDLGKELLMGVFVNGLKEEIRAELRLLRPKSLEDLIEQAHRVEEKNWVMDRCRPKPFKTQGAKESYTRVSNSPDLTRPDPHGGPTQQEYPVAPTRPDPRGGPTHQNYQNPAKTRHRVHPIGERERRRMELRVSEEVQGELSGDYLKQKFSLNGRGGSASDVTRSSGLIIAAEVNPYRFC